MAREEFRQVVQGTFTIRMETDQKVQSLGIRSPKSASCSKATSSLFLKGLNVQPLSRERVEE